MTNLEVNKGINYYIFMKNFQNNQKKTVHNYWNKASCGTEVTQKQKFSQSYFDEIEKFRYRIEPEIFSFAQFTRFYRKKVLEVGVGAGTDFVQWVRAGAHAYGVDLTKEALENTTKRLALQNLKPADLQVADAEQLPYETNFFDCVYSWGVIHHSPNTEQCLKELIRVTKHGGIIKLMVYNRRSLFAFYRYLLAGLLKGKPFQSLSKILYENQESKGTKAYTKKEIKKMIKRLPVNLTSLQTPATSHDLLYYKSKWWRRGACLLATICGHQRSGWFMMIELKKIDFSAKVASL